MKIISHFTLSLLASAIVFGQTDSVSSGPPVPTMNRTPPDLSLPIDSGLLFLLIVGLGYGIYITSKRMKLKNIAQ